MSAGIVNGEPVLDLDYREDSTAEVDMNVVRLGSGGFVEVQGTGEGGTFSRGQLDALLDLAEHGIDQLTDLQRAVARIRVAAQSISGDRHSPRRGGFVCRRLCRRGIVIVSSLGRPCLV